MGLIPLTALDVENAEPDARDYLPAAMRQPGLADVVMTTPVSPLSGLQAWSANMIVLLTAQADARENGPWSVQSGAWTRQSAGPVSPVGAMTASSLVHRYVMLVARGANAGFWWLTSPDPVVPSRTDQTWAKLGSHLYAWHADMAERDIWNDLNKRHQPIRASSLASYETLTRALAYRTAMLLCRGGKVASKGEDEAARRATWHDGRYQSELEQAVLLSQGGARIRGGGMKVLRG
jgi:hypothetical protein